MSILGRIFSRGRKSGAPQKAGGYGLSPSDPVMAVQPNRYFRHLRCPAGQGVKWRRRGSTIVTDMSFIKRRGGKTIPGATLIPPSEDHVAVDIYTMECDCGQHRIEEVFVDMYHNALDQCIDAKDWTFVDAFPDRRILQAGEVTSRE